MKEGKEQKLWDVFCWPACHVAWPIPLPKCPADICHSISLPHFPWGERTRTIELSNCTDCENQHRSTKMLDVGRETGREIYFWGVERGVILQRRWKAALVETAGEAVIVSLLVCGRDVMWVCTCNIVYVHYTEDSVVWRKEVTSLSKLKLQELCDRPVRLTHKN